MRPSWSLEEPPGSPRPPPLVRRAAWRPPFGQQAAKARASSRLLRLLLFVDDLVVALFDDLVIGRLGAVAARRRLRLLRRRLGVDGLRELLRGLLERLSLLADLVHVRALEDALQLHDPAFDGRGVGLV